MRVIARRNLSESLDRVREESRFMDMMTEFLVKLIELEERPSAVFMSTRQLNFIKWISAKAPNQRIYEEGDLAKVCGCPLFIDDRFDKPMMDWSRDGESA